ncbi:MAG: hypothetical protein ACI4IF_01635 [Acutalibacteraceae bacterium]
MIDYYEIEKNLMKEIEEEKGFSWKKLGKIIRLNALFNYVK